MKDFFKQIFTDTAGRWEIKIIIGLIVCILAILYGIFTRDWEGFSKLAVFGGSCLGLSTATDAIVDIVNKNVSGKEGQ
jgi:hypothetical protein